MADGDLVYSTDGGDRRHPGRRQAREASASRRDVPGDGVVRVGRTRSGRKGKEVTIVTGLPGAEADLRDVCGELKRLCGSGGAVKDGAIEIQGDHRERIRARLEALGHAVKLTGG